MQGCRRTAFIRSWLLAAASLVALTASVASAQGLRVEVHPDAQAAFAALAAAYHAPLAQDATDAELVLRPGSVAWDDRSSVAVTDSLVLERLLEDEAAVAFQRFAAGPDAQRALIDAGLLPASVIVVDQTGRSVVVPQPVERVFSGYGVATYLVYALGAGDRLVVGNYLGARDPEGAAAMERIDPRFPERNAETPADTTNVEFVASLGTDLVLAGGSSEWTGPVEAIGIAVLGFAGETPERMREAVRIAGAALGPDAAARAEAWVSYYDRVLADVERAVSDLEARPRVLFTGTERTRVASGAMYQSAIIDLAGGVSVSTHLSGSWNDVDVEQVLTWNPEVVLVPPYGRASVAAVVEDAEWRLLDAVRDGAVYRVPKLVAPWDTPVPDSVLAIVWLAETLHGELSGLDCAAETRFFYERFYDYAISDAEVSALCQR